MKIMPGTESMAPFLLKLGGEWSGFRPDHFTHGKKTPVSIHQKAEWAPEPVSTFWRR